MGGWGSRVLNLWKCENTRFLRNFCGRYFRYVTGKNWYFRYVSLKPLRWVGGVRCLRLFPKKKSIFFMPSLCTKISFISTLIFATPSLQDWSCDPLCNGCPAPPPNNCWCQHHCSSNAIDAKQSGHRGHYVCAISHLMYESGCNQCVFSNSWSPMGDLW